MVPSPQPGAVLNVPPAPPAHYARNFIRLAVCELRFPTLFELDGAAPPVALSKALRKEYPTYETLKLLVNTGGGNVMADAHGFRSKKNRWTVVLRSSALALETSHYDSFADFEVRVEKMIDAARSTIDTDFFTRVGLRYINHLPCKTSDLDGWVNPELVQPLTAGVFGDVAQHFLRVRGTTDVGGYTFTHAIGDSRVPGAIFDGTNADTKPSDAVYMIDLDFFREEVAVGDAMTTLRQLHEREFALFDWSLGPKAKEHLGNSDLEAKK